MRETKIIKIKIAPKNINAKKQKVRRYSRKKVNLKNKLRNDFIYSLIGLSTFITIWLIYNIIV